MRTSTILSLVILLLVGSSKADVDWPLTWGSSGFTNPELLWWILDWFIPDSLIENNVVFYTYSRSNYEIPERLWIGNEAALANSHFDVSKKTIIVLHGYATDYTAKSAQGIKKELLTYDNVNVITPDYGNINYDPSFVFIYTAAKSYKIGNYIGRLVMFLIDQGVDPDEIQIIGHSLGAHVAGFAAKYAKSKGKQIGRVTALDPCYPVFEYNTASYRLASDDAKFTDCIFTTYGVLGMGFPACQANFFPNGVGMSQPGCPPGRDMSMGSSCGHSRVVDYFIESIKPVSHFRVQSCDGVPEVLNPTRCWPTDKTVMGQCASPTVSGLFYLNTNAMSPYSKG